MLKKWICVLLCFVLTVTTVSFCIGAENDELPFIVASDLHYFNTPYSVSNNFPGEKYYTADKESTLMCAESNAIVREFLRQAAQSDAEFVLIAGDMTDSGTAEQQRAVAQLFRTFEQSTGKKIFVINGNHDFNDGISVETFKAQYADFGYNEALAVDANTCSYTADLSAKYRLIAFDSCNHVYGADGVTQERLDWLQTQVSQAKADGKEPIVMMHHSFLEHLKFQSVFMANYIVSSEWEMRKHFTEWGVRYVFTGHQHAQDVTVYTDKQTGKKVYDILTGALSCYPCAYRTATLSDSGLTLETKRITAVRREDLPKSGYSAELLQELTTDLGSFAYGVFVVNFNDRKSFLFSEWAIQSMLTKLKLDFLSGIVSAFCPTFFAYLDMPLYEKNARDGVPCLETMAKDLGLSIPQSEYRTLSDVLAYFASVYFYGDENLPAEDSRIDLFMQGLYTVLYTSLRDVSASEREQLLSDVQANFKEHAAPYMVTRLGRVIVGGSRDERVLQLTVLLFSPFIELYSKDDGVPDNDVFLSATDDAPNTAIQWIANIIEWVVRFFLHYINGLNRLAKMYSLR